MDVEEGCLRLACLSARLDRDLRLHELSFKVGDQQYHLKQSNGFTSVDDCGEEPGQR